jgi:hypothetical protein
LYADSAGLDSESINLEALETLVTVSGMAVELLSLTRPAPRRSVEERPVEAEPTYTPTSEYAAPEPPPEPAIGETSFASLDTVSSYHPEPEVIPVVEATPVEEVEPEPVIAEPEPVSLGEAPPAWEVQPEEAAPAWTPPPPAEPAAAPAPTRRRYGQDAELPVEVSGEEERRLHNDARRFARLLISEIKLYNEQKVAEGRSEHDLYDRLREYIDRSREMYDKRVKAEVAARYDYFHGELVNTLAEGDASKLGSNYPGATVNA